MRSRIMIAALLSPFILGSALGAAEESGRRIYESTCVACHGADGEGTLPGVPDFTDPSGRLSKPDGELIEAMVNGVQGPDSPLAMPPKGGNPALTRDDLERVLHYMREEFLGR